MKIKPHIRFSLVCIVLFMIFVVFITNINNFSSLYNEYNVLQDKIALEEKEQINHQDEIRQQLVKEFQIKSRNASMSKVEPTELKKLKTKAQVEAEQAEQKARQRNSNSTIIVQ